MKQLKSNNVFENKYILSFFILFTLVILTTQIFIKPIHTDEGWFHSYAKAKNDFGEYRTPAFYDIAPKEDHYNQTFRGIVQIYRLGDVIFPKNHIAAIKFVRFIGVLLWIAVWFFLTKSFKISNLTWAFVFSSINPIFLNIIATGRSEVYFGALILLIFHIVNKDNIDTEVKFYRVTIIAAILLLFHPNAIIIFISLAITLIFYAKIKTVIRFYFLFLFIGILFYLTFVDYFWPYYNEKLISTGSIVPGGNRKFITDISSLPTFIFNEIKYRYLLYASSGLKLYIIRLTGFVIPIIMGIREAIKVKNHNRIIIISLMISLIFIGNKYIGYAIYFFPILVIFAYSHLTKLRRYVFQILLLFFAIISIYSVYWNITEKNIQIRVSSKVKKILNKNDILYSGFSFSPYLMDYFEFYTLNDKKKEDIITFCKQKKECYLLTKNELQNVICSFPEYTSQKIYNDYLLIKIGSCDEK